jgi:DNA helicase-2/ATP-dependent DNA helicase PcrA
MLNPTDLLTVDSGSVVAPAGHGKTEVIASLAALAKRTLILTHTHAGVHAIRARIKKYGSPSSKISVDTIAGWCMAYAHAFPKAAQPCEGMPRTPAQWDQLYMGVISALKISAVREVFKASYDRVLIDEYQDCNQLQHTLAIEIAHLVPTLIFGDPMQGIFAFAGATLDWDTEIHPYFPNLGTLDVPYRWLGKNEELGRWIAETRIRLQEGQRIDLQAGPIKMVNANDAFDMGALFDFEEDKAARYAAIHCNKGLCYRIAKASGGGYQAIEEIAALRLQSFAEQWDSASIVAHRALAFTSLLSDCINIIPPIVGHGLSAEDAAIGLETLRLQSTLMEQEAALSISNLLAIVKKRSDFRLFRREVWRDAERATGELVSGRARTMQEAVGIIKQATAKTGRFLPYRTVSTPLLLKGLEFDHVVVPHAAHFTNEQLAGHKLFYVAISRATKTLTITSSERYLQFPAP